MNTEDFVQKLGSLEDSFRLISEKCQLISNAINGII